MQVPASQYEKLLKQCRLHRDWVLGSYAKVLAKTFNQFCNIDKHKANPDVLNKI